MKKPIIGKEDFETLFPELANEWSDKNEVKPNEVFPYAKEKYIWECKLGHEWENSTRNRIKYTKCPICNGTKVLSGFNDLETKFPNIAKEWSYKNELKPNEVFPSSRKKVIWECSKGHEWEAYIYSRSRINNNGSGCPYCSGQKVLQGVNDLATKFPQLASEWDYDLNDKKPNEVSCYTSYKVWWKCKLNHSWQSTIGNRTRRGDGCPYCSGRRILKGFNDLESRYPELASEWDYELNDKKPSEVSCHNAYKAWWKCKYGHSWEAKVCHRTDGGGCPKCNNHSSFGEQAIYYYLKEIGAKNRYKFHGKEIDIYIEKLNIGIEFNGIFWHKDRLDKDLEKELYLSHYMKMFYVLEGNENKIINNKIYFNTKNYNLNLEWAIKNLFIMLGFNNNVDLEKDKQNIYKNFSNKELENSLAIKYPKLAKEWNYEKNILTPEQISGGSSIIKIWWTCKRGHNYQTTPNARVYKGTGCPICANKKILVGFNDLETTHGYLLNEWDYDKNKILPSEISAGSNKKIHWKCSCCGYEWETYINNKIKSKYTCPKCKNKPSCC